MSLYFDNSLQSTPSNSCSIDDDNNNNNNNNNNWPYHNDSHHHGPTNSPFYANQISSSSSPSPSSSDQFDEELDDQKQSSEQTPSNSSTPGSPCLIITPSTSSVNDQTNIINNRVCSVSSISCNNQSNSNTSASDSNDLQSKSRALCLQTKEVPVYKFRFSNSEFLLNGDVYMNFETADFTRIGTMNKFKRMCSVIVEKQTRQMTIHMDSTQRGLDDFTHLIAMCRQQPLKSIHVIANLLQQHQDRVATLMNFTTMLHKMPRYQDFIEASEVCFQSFQQRCQAELKRMVANSSIKFYKTKTVKVNLERGCYELQQMCMSELLLALLGISTEQAKQFVLRKGMFEFTFSLEEFGQELHFLSMFREDPELYSFNSVIKTFDGMDVQCVTRFYMLHNTDNFLRQRAGLKLTDFFLVVDYDITPNMLRQLVHYRKNDVQKFNFAQLENEQDWDYFIQSKEFVNHFDYSFHV